jgi:dihydrofolate reductase
LAVASADGFIARHVGHSPAEWASGEEQRRFLDIMARLDWAFMGRHTHEAAYRPDRRRVIFSRAADGMAWQGPNHLVVNPERVPLEDILTAVRPRGPCGILGGAAVYGYFLDRNRVDRIDLTIEPVLFGSGLPLLPATSWGDVPAFLLSRGFTATGIAQRLNADGTVVSIYDKTNPPASPGGATTPEA